MEEKMEFSNIQNYQSHIKRVLISEEEIKRLHEPFKEDLPAIGRRIFYLFKGESSVFFPLFFPNCHPNRPEPKFFARTVKRSVHKDFGPFSTFFIHPVLPTPTPRQRFLPVSVTALRLSVSGPETETA